MTETDPVIEILDRLETVMEGRDVEDVVTALLSAAATEIENAADDHGQKNEMFHEAIMVLAGYLGIEVVEETGGAEDHGGTVH